MLAPGDVGPIRDAFRAPGQDRIADALSPTKVDAAIRERDEADG